MIWGWGGGLVQAALWEAFSSPRGEDVLGAALEVGDVEARPWNTVPREQISGSRAASSVRGCFSVALSPPFPCHSHVRMPVSPCHCQHWMLTSNFYQCDREKACCSLHCGSLGRDCVWRKAAPHCAGHETPLPVSRLLVDLAPLLVSIRSFCCWFAGASLTPDIAFPEAVSVFARLPLVF